MLAVSLRRLGSGGHSGRVGNVGGAALPFLLPVQQRATFVDVKMRCVRDRGLDHAVEKEKNLRPFHALKDLLLRGDPPPLSLPLGSISARGEELGFPCRPISFIRRYPNAFIEDPPPVPPSPPSSPSSPTSSTTSPDAVNPSRFQPRIRATEELISIHKEEVLAYESCRADAADRLLRLLMLTRKRALPLHVVDRLSWDLGLPPDYPRSLLPEFPDYFQVADDRLELVCWNKDLAVSAVEQSAPKGFENGMALAFPVQVTGSLVDKKVKKWMDEWQKLPYRSPYTDFSKTDPNTASGEKWTVAVLHELLHLLVPKKMERENLLQLSTIAGLKRTFVKNILANYPGIFYTSDRNGISTIVLRDAYKRGALVKSHRLMEIRYQYIHLMHRRPEKNGANAGKKKKKGRKDAAKEAAGKEDNEEFEEEETEGEWDESSDYESEESSDEDFGEFGDGEKVLVVEQTSTETPGDNGSAPLSSPTVGLKAVNSVQVRKSKLRGVEKSTGAGKISASAKVLKSTREKLASPKNPKSTSKKLASSKVPKDTREMLASSEVPKATGKDSASTKVSKAHNQLRFAEITSQLKTRKFSRGSN